MSFKDRTLPYALPPGIVGLVCVVAGYFLSLKTPIPLWSYYLTLTGLTVLVCALVIKTILVIKYENVDRSQ